MNWISVKDRLPKTDGAYLCCAEGYKNPAVFEFKKLFEEEEKHENAFWDYDSEWGYLFCEVTHWQPLPEPPKEESKC